MVGIEAIGKSLKKEDHRFILSVLEYRKENAMVVDTMDLLELTRKHLGEASPDLLREMVKRFAELLMSVDADGACNAAYGDALLSAPTAATATGPGPGTPGPAASI